MALNVTGLPVEDVAYPLSIKPPGSTKTEEIGMALNVTGLTVEDVAYPPSIKPPGSTKTMFLSGAGLRDGYRDGKYMKFSSVSVYLEESAVPWLAAKWKGKTAEELEASEEFLKDVVNGPYEKLLYVTAIGPVTGERWANNQRAFCKNLWEPLGIYTEAEAKALDKFYEVMKDAEFPTGSSALLTLSPHGSFSVSFSKDGSIPKDVKAVIENKLLTEEILGGIIGKIGVSPATRKSVVERLTELINEQVEVETGKP